MEFLIDAIDLFRIFRIPDIDGDGHDELLVILDLVPCRSQRDNHFAIDFC